MYRALYRKWRPQRFEDVIGQQAITTALKNQLLHGRLGHAYLFTGTRGTGKTTCAKIFAKAVNCLSLQQGEPCCDCELCKGIDAGGVMDVAEIDAASNNGIDHIRDLRDETIYAPSTGRYKVYIIDEVHMLSVAAFNALLKIMEEPPAHIIFILATTEIHKVPATILSRCQRYDFMRISAPLIAERLLKVADNEQIELTQSAAGVIARLSDGAMRDALSVLDTCAGLGEPVTEALVQTMAGAADRQALFHISQAVYERQPAEALRVCASLRESSVDMKRLCDELMLHYRNLLLANVTGDASLLYGICEQDEQKYLQDSAQMTEKEILCALDQLSIALERMSKGADSRIELELALFRLMAPQAVQEPLLQPERKALAIQRLAPPDALLASEQSAEESQMPKAPVTQMSPITPENHVQIQQAECQPFEQWPMVVEAMRTRDAMLYANLKGTAAYYDGRRVLIDGGELFLKYMRANEYSTALLKQVMTEVSGVRCGIGPYRPLNSVKEQTAVHTAESTLKQLHSAGVDVVYVDEEQKKEL